MPEEEREDRTQEENLGFLKRATAMLAEHFDTVQIFVTRHIGESGTVSVKYGTGNYFARKGQCAEWVRGEDAAVDAQQFKHVNEEDEP